MGEGGWWYFLHIVCTHYIFLPLQQESKEESGLQKKRTKQQLDRTKFSAKRKIARRSRVWGWERDGWRAASAVCVKDYFPVQKGCDVAGDVELLEKTLLRGEICLSKQAGHHLFASQAPCAQTSALPK